MPRPLVPTASFGPLPRAGGRCAPVPAVHAGLRGPSRWSRGSAARTSRCSAGLPWGRSRRWRRRSRAGRPGAGDAATSPRWRHP
ncbi:hypothetical protein G6F35_018979 [Rhizopus arrhizus]|nr:hypothetical protein G6F35_018979 [Rhizopus arrhizus]